MSWWVWVLLGFALLAAEVATLGAFYFFFFGLGAVAVGCIVRAGVGGAAWVQWMLFSVLSVAGLILFRDRLIRRLRARTGPAERVDALVGQVAVLLEDVSPGEVGKAELRGAAWTARNAGARALRRGTRGKVTHVDGLTLWLEAE